ncbi:MAG: MalY/PatB family protein [Bacilli bacterium]|jgi:cystathionine beta-lyase
MKRFNKKVSRKNTNCVKWDLLEDDILPFSIADSDYATSEAIVKCLITRAKHPIYGYTYPDQEYFESLMRWTKKRYGYQITKENIIPASGVVTSLYYAIKYLKDQVDGVIIQTPAYHPFFSITLDNGLKIIENPLINHENYYSIDFDLLEKQIDHHKIILLCNPHNPTGRAFRHEELQRIVELAKKHDVFILSDEIHCDILLNDNKFLSLNLFSDVHNKIIVFNSISKSFNLAGLKTSNIIIKDQEIADDFRAFLRSNYYGSGNLFGLTALKAAYNCAEKWLDAQNRHLSNNYNILRNYLNQHYPQVGVNQQEATYLAWLDLSFLGIPCPKMHEELIRRGMIINEGQRYSRDCPGFIRFNFACSEEQLIKGLNILGNFIDDYRKPVTKHG